MALGELATLMAFGQELLAMLGRGVGTALRSGRVTAGLRLLAALQVRLRAACRRRGAPKPATDAGSGSTTRPGKTDPMRPEYQRMLRQYCDLRVMPTAADFAAFARGLAWDGDPPEPDELNEIWHGRRGGAPEPVQALPDDRTVSEIAAEICEAFGLTSDMPQWPAALLAMHMTVRDLEREDRPEDAGDFGVSGADACPHPPAAEATGPSLSRAAGEGQEAAGSGVHGSRGGRWRPDIITDG